jgi:hypothetical protein
MFTKACILKVCQETTENLHQFRRKSHVWNSTMCQTIRQVQMVYLGQLLQPYMGLRWELRADIRR